MSPKKLNAFFCALIVLLPVLFVLRLAAESLKNGILMGLFLLLLWLFCVAVYLIPTAVASSRHHPNLPGLFCVNFFLGWTLAGWVGALVWALHRPIATTPPPIPQGSIEDKLRTLEKLQSDGLISAEEYKEQRSVVLSSLASP